MTPSTTITSLLTETRCASLANFAGSAVTLTELFFRQLEHLGIATSLADDHGEDLGVEIHPSGKPAR